MGTPLVVRGQHRGRRRPTPSWPSGKSMSAAIPPSQRPCAARPCQPRFAARASVVACRLETTEPTWELTPRGMAVALALVGAVMGAALVTCLAVLWLISSPS